MNAANKVMRILFSVHGHGHFTAMCSLSNLKGNTVD